jgi:hypothetical protein
MFGSLLVHGSQFTFTGHLTAFIAIRSRTGSSIFMLHTTMDLALWTYQSVLIPAWKEQTKWVMAIKPAVSTA